MENISKDGYVEAASDRQVDGHPRSAIETLVASHGGDVEAAIREALSRTERGGPVLGGDVATSVGVTYLQEVLAVEGPDVVGFVTRCVNDGVSLSELVSILTVVQTVVLQLTEKTAASPVDPTTTRAVFVNDIGRIASVYVTVPTPERGVASRDSSTIAALVDQVGAVDVSVTEIASLADQQAANMENVNREIGGISAAVEEIAVTTESINHRSDETSSLAQQGATEAYSISARMEEIHTRATHVARAVEDLESHVDEIDDVVQTIDDIADRTNLLALNASIEAARVNQDGNGFAVVANEVKKLAEKSKDEAAEIEAIVSTIKEASITVFENIEGVCEQTQTGVQDAEQAIETFDEIESFTVDLARSIDEIATATSQQSEGTEEVAMMVDEASRKAELISSEISAISRRNEDVLETVTSFAP